MSATEHQDGGTVRTLVVMPAYNAARTLEATYHAIPKDVVDEILLVDDGSGDATLEVAASLPLRTIGLPHNVGYGGNQKTCYLEALRLGAEVVVMLHPDGQYDPALLPDLVAPILSGDADMVLGSRMLLPGGARAGGMPLYRLLSNRVLTSIENRMLGTRFSELHTGYRAYSRRFLEAVPFMRNSDDFVFDTQLITQAVAFDRRIVEVPIHTRYFPEASSTSMRANVRYGIGTLWTMVRYRLHRAGVLRSRLFTE
ncbi:MAG: glycosyltransferase family 2 protein [Actinomycetota bacterium]|nr:glycosyltransferase family 2 protein [Actinomycetota bacterium]